MSSYNDLCAYMYYWNVYLLGSMIRAVEGMIIEQNQVWTYVICLHS